MLPLSTPIILSIGLFLPFWGFCLGDRASFILESFFNDRTFCSVIVTFGGSVALAWLYTTCLPCSPLVSLMTLSYCFGAYFVLMELFKTPKTVSS